MEHWLWSYRGKHVNGHQDPRENPDKLKMNYLTMMNMKCMKNEKKNIILNIECFFYHNKGLGGASRY